MLVPLGGVDVAYCGMFDTRADSHIHSCPA